VLIANLMTEPGETDDYSVLEHLLTIERHLGAQLFDVVIYNTSPMPDHLSEAYRVHGSLPIVTRQLRAERARQVERPPIGVPLVSEHPPGKIRHHPEGIAAAIAALGRGKPGAQRADEDSL
jgi:2-phospho-L-lactate transferase/gluconeogenesis factor (CofD/UPF0052 family)